ncbi:MAG: hypothetical protein LUG54_05705 [Clostridiales bacterium]|nr:hypothetical protein [Clostridiales bacterium]
MHELWHLYSILHRFESSGEKNEKNPKSYAFIAADKELLYNSSSGGVFALLAELAFERQGVVVGAAWKNDFSVEHVLIEEKKIYRSCKNQSISRVMWGKYSKMLENA